MIRSPHRPPGQRREGIILVVVVSLLALFAVVGLGYVMYAESAAAASRMSAESQKMPPEAPTVDVESILNAALGQLIFDLPDDQTGVYSTVRGHSLARSAFGWNYTPMGPFSFNPDGNNNVVAFNGLGRVRYFDATAGVDSSQLINYQLGRYDQYIHDPERYPIDPSKPNSYRANPRNGNLLAPITLAGSPTAYFGGANVPYTYPDNNNVYLAAVRASDGQVLIPSFHRPYLFAPGFLASINNGDWYQPASRYKLLRPRPIDQLSLADIQSVVPSFPNVTSFTATQIKALATLIQIRINEGKVIPYPEDQGGDVKNLLGSPGGNDSVWVDLGLPVRTTASGKKYKPLVAFLITDLDGRINLNASGNIRGTALTHASNQGLGRHEINISKVLNVELYGGTPTAPSEWRNVFHMLGSTLVSRYDNAQPAIAHPYYLTVNDSMPSFLTTVPSSPLPGVTYWSSTPAHMLVDVDGSNELAGGSPSARMAARQLNINEPLTLSSFPSFADPVTGLPLGLGNDSPAERLSHPQLFNPLRASGNSRTFDARDMHLLIGRYQSNSKLDYSESYLAQLLPMNMGMIPGLNSTQLAQAARIRHSITLASADLGRTGLTANVMAIDMATPVPTPAGVAKSSYTWDATRHMPLAAAGEAFPSTVFAQPAGAPLSLFRQVQQIQKWANMWRAANPQAAMLANPVSDVLGAPMPLKYAPQPATGTPGFQPPAGSVHPINDPTTTYSFDGRSRLPALLSRLDLNRPLRPYPQPIADTSGNGKYFDATNPNVIAAYRQADADRRQFAKDIYDRLKAAVGAPDIGTANTQTTPAYLTHKWLAQLAANIVDYIDEDDVMTTFQWVSNAQLTGWFPGNEATQLRNYTVHGVEMPKVVLNETYLEMTNGPDMGANGDPAYVQPPSGGSAPKPARAIKYQVNVWVELNHTMVPPVVAENDPIRYASFVQQNAVWLKNGPPSGTFSTYRIVMMKRPATPATGETAPEIIDPANTSQPAQGPGASSGPKVVDFATASAPQELVLMPVNTSLQPPSGGSQAPCSYRCKDNTKNEGFYVVGPSMATPPRSPAFSFSTPGASFKHANMSFDTARATGPGNVDGLLSSGGDIEPPTIVLQRLACPYLPESPTNPYVTVDRFDLQNKTPDAASVMSTVNRSIWVNAAGPVTGTSNPGSSTTRKAVGRRQPFAGYIDALGGATTVKQFLAMQPPPSGSDPQHTFFSHNTSSPSVAPAVLPEPAPTGTLDRFQWMIHPDRKMLSPMELLFVSAVPPYDVTHKFISPDPTNPGQVIYQGHTARWSDAGLSPTPQAYPHNGTVGPAPGLQPQPSTRLYRALEMFRVGDRTVEMAFGGRDIGKVNINTIWDRNVFDAICDALASAGATDFTQADVDAAWAAMMAGRFSVTAGASSTVVPNYSARTPNYYSDVAVNTSSGMAIITGATLDTNVYNQISVNDRPFWGFGAPHESPAMPSSPYNPTPQFPPPTDGGPLNAGVDATLLRGLYFPSGATPMKRKALFDVESYAVAETNGTVPVKHPIMEKALLSKISEHLTTRSNVFAVYMTVGYFEVTDDTQKPELLGGELGVIRDVNGLVVENKAIRHRMFAIVDRTNLTLQPGFYSNGNLTALDGDRLRQGPAPFFYKSAVQQVLTAGPDQGAWVVQVPITGFQQQGASGPIVTVSGSYNGAGWSLRAGNVVFVGIGGEQRRLVVKSMTHIPATSSSPDMAALVIGVPRSDGSWPPLDAPSVPPDGAAEAPQVTALITNAVLGNPGPQADFDLRNARFQAVVPYAVILE